MPSTSTSFQHRTLSPHRAPAHQKLGRYQLGLNKQPRPPNNHARPRKGSFTEVLSPNDGPPAYTAAVPHKDSVSPPTPPKDFPPHGMPRRPSRSVSPANRLPRTFRETTPDDQYMAGGRHSHDPLVDTARYEEPGFYGRRGYGRGGYRNAKNYRAANIISFVVFVVRGSTIKRALQFSTDFAT